MERWNTFMDGYVNSKKIPTYTMGTLKLHANLTILVG